MADLRVKSTVGLSENVGCLRTWTCRCSRFRWEATGVLACFTMKEVSWWACTLVAVTEGDVQYHRPFCFPCFILRRKLQCEEKYGYQEGWREISWQKYFLLPDGLQATRNNNTHFPAC